MLSIGKLAIGLSTICKTIPNQTWKTPVMHFTKLLYTNAICTEQKNDGSNYFMQWKGLPVKKSKVGSKVIGVSVFKKPNQNVHNAEFCPISFPQQLWASHGFECKVLRNTPIVKANTMYTLILCHNLQTYCILQLE